MDPTTLSIVGGGGGPGARGAARLAQRGGGGARAGNDLARDAVVATVFVVGSRADPDASAASRAADDALEAVARSDRWVAELDAPGGPRSAEAGVRVPAPIDEKEEKSDEECDGGDPSSGGERNAWTPLVTRVRVPRLPKDAAVEVQFVLLDGAGPGAAPAKTSASYVDDRADDSDEDDDGGTTRRPGDAWFRSTPNASARGSSRTGGASRAPPSRGATSPPPPWRARWRRSAARCAPPAWDGSTRGRSAGTTRFRSVPTGRAKKRTFTKSSRGGSDRRRIRVAVRAGARAGGRVRGDARRGAGAGALRGDARAVRRTRANVGE